MVVDELSDAQVDAMFRALADATRRDIVTRVFSEGVSVSQLALKYEMSFAAVQKHVAILHTAGLVTKQRQGREQIVRGDVRTIQRAQELLARLEDVWTQRVLRMEAVLNAE
ncbi:MAG: ArsR family transcriptional regulator [Rhodoglobus sp.]|uniref:ArsR/SmtB family transcription factor n=1 Tax=uncultured Salinibacterium sp. TaxID=459274 RepID=UPI0030D93699|tara:strand:- start:1377 stop:1709 length:333 start_codon:yes stop_codon:yes gene_type:complete